MKEHNKKDDNKKENSRMSNSANTEKDTQSFDDSNVELTKENSKHGSTHSKINASDIDSSKSNTEEKNSPELNAAQVHNFTNDEILGMVASLEEFKNESNTLRDELLRAKAEQENSRKRLVKHYDELSKEKTKRLLLDIIELLDNFERAFDAVQKTEDEQGKSLIEGIRMIEAQFMQILENKWNIQRFDSYNQPFDPDRHEAMMKAEQDDVTEPTVVEEFSKGYLFEEKLLRTAKVKVAVPK